MSPIEGAHQISVLETPGAYLCRREVLATLKPILPPPFPQLLMAIPHPPW